MKNLISVLLLFTVMYFQVLAQFQNKMDTENYVQYVNPFIGTKNMGHTFPGAAAPFGMVQVSPETNIQPMYLEDGSYNKDTYRYCAGYQYEDSTIFGFSHTHFSGTGHSDLGDILIMPTTGGLNLEPGTTDKTVTGFNSKFSHATESAEPGYYSVLLNDYQIKAELTATERAGFHRYTFLKGGDVNIILDMIYNIYGYEGKNIWTFIRIENDSTITGWRQTSGWARTRFVYFAIQFSKPFQNYGYKRYDEVKYSGFYRRFKESQNFPEMTGKEIRAYFSFQTDPGEEILVRTALSPVGTAGAMKNLNAEIPHWNFDKVKNETQKKWNNELSKMKVESLTNDDKITFYSALYHTMLSPIIYEDVDGSYRGLDQNIHNSESFTNYSIFSLWDTFRALHPLYNVIQQKRNEDMIKSMLVHYEQSVHKMLPVWSHYANENWCMIGYHSVPVIVDAIIKDAADINPVLALEACINSSNLSYYDELGFYVDSGFVPEDKTGSSVSKTLEFAYDDWTISKLAEHLGKKDISKIYSKRAKNYKNVFDEDIRFARPKLSDGSWKEDFDPLDTHGQGFIEGNAWTYSLFVPHDITGLMELLGGEEKFMERLDSLFTMELDDKYFAETEDITRDGIIGNYVHGNEPGHHIPYLYNWTSQPWKTQEKVRMIIDEMYGSGEDGLCGNDDAGQMSAWYIFSSLGFYPVCPGDDKYWFGSPSVVQGKINLENGKTFTVKTINQSRENIYVEKIILNGEELTRNYITHSEIINGGELTFCLSPNPAKK
ncbi:MAG: GH92 family glycosyl hydrolase [Melioribacteraceae bacterium]|nr:GH92 family glycosyl hydrolase [Melioribacteraceae bacterium]